MYALPPDQQKALQEIQASLLRNVARAVKAHAGILSGQARTLLTRILSGDMTHAQIKRAIRRVVGHASSDLQARLAILLKDASEYADRYIRRLQLYAVDQKSPIRAFAAKAADLSGAAAKAASSYAAGRGLLAQKGAKALSRKLHILAQAEADEVSRRVIRAISEAQELQFASRELVEIASGRAVGAAEDLPKAVRRVKKSLTKLSAIPGTKTKRKALAAMVRKVAGERKPGGRVQAAYVELADDLAKNTVPKAAIQKWIYQKQRYRAETILWTETAAAYRLKQAGKSSSRPWITGYLVKMTRNRHSRFTATKPGKLKALGGRHCLCEVYDGTVVTPEEYRSRWFAGFHPRCGCNFTEVVDRNKLFSLRK